MTNAKKNEEIMKKNQIELRKLEEFYVNNKIEDMFSDIEERKKELVKDMIDYREKAKVPVNWDNNGNPTEYQVSINPIIIMNYFFKPITPISSHEPMYNAEKLGMVFDYYCEVLSKVNELIGFYPSSLISFCKMAGITLNTLRSYKNSTDLNMRIIVEKIYDQIGDENTTMGQMGMVKERSTMFKLRSQNEMVEKQQPNVNINIIEEPDMEKINKRINKYKYFANKK